MLEVRGAEISYGKVRAVQQADLVVRAGEVVSLIGLNGAGKSSLLRAIAGLTRVQAGTITFQGPRWRGARSRWCWRVAPPSSK